MNKYKRYKYHFCIIVSTIGLSTSQIDDLKSKIEKFLSLFIDDLSFEWDKESDNSTVENQLEMSFCNLELISAFRIAELLRAFCSFLAVTLLCEDIVEHEFV